MLKNTGCSIAVSPGKRTPLNRHGKKQRIQGNEVIQIRRQQAGNQHGSSIDSQAERLHRQPGVFGENDGQGQGSRIDCKSDDPDQPVGIRVSGSIHGNRDQIGSLGGTKRSWWFRIANPPRNPPITAILR